MTESDPNRLADELEREVDVLEQRSEKLGGDAERVRQDWEQKRHDPNVPGAPPPERDEAGETGNPPAPETDVSVKAPDAE